MDNLLGELAALYMCQVITTASQQQKRCCGVGRVICRACQKQRKHNTGGRNEQTQKSSPSTYTSSYALFFKCFIPLSLCPVGSLHVTKNPLLLACYAYGLTHTSLHETINSPRNLFLFNYPEHAGSKPLQNNGNKLPINTAPHQKTIILF